MPTFHLQTNGGRRCGHAACPKPAGRHSQPHSTGVSLHHPCLQCRETACPPFRSSQVLLAGGAGPPATCLSACCRQRLPPLPWHFLLSAVCLPPCLTTLPSPCRPVKGCGPGDGQARGGELQPAWQHCNPCLHQCNAHTATRHGAALHNTHTHSLRFLLPACPPACLPARPPACPPALPTCLPACSM